MLFERLDSGIIQCQREKDDWFENEWYESLQDVTKLLMALEYENTNLRLFGEPESAGNWDMYFKIYDAYAGVKYLVLGAEFEKYATGEMIELEPQPLEMEDLVEMERESGDTSSLYQLRIVTDLQFEEGNWYEIDGYYADEVVLTDQDDPIEVMRDLEYELPERCEVRDDDFISIYQDDRLLAYFIPIE